MHLKEIATFATWSGNYIVRIYVVKGPYLILSTIKLTCTCTKYELFCINIGTVIMQTISGKSNKHNINEKGRKK